MNAYISLADNQVRQLIDSTTVFRRFLLAWERATRYRDKLYWKETAGREYLIRQAPGGARKQTSFGVRSPETERIFAAYDPAREEARAVLRDSTNALEEAQRLNRALRVGRAPAILVDLLRAFEAARIGQHFIVVGTNALYAYETASGVQIIQSALATQDIDLLWDARKKVSFVTDMQATQASMLDLLKKVDRTFERDPLKREAAVNSRGVEVEFLRREPVDGDEHPFPLTPTPGDLFVVPAKRAATLADAKRFNHVVVAATGKMALMRTVDPQVFVDFKRWLAKDAPAREGQKRQRDATQAQIIEELLQASLLMPESSMDDVAKVIGAQGAVE